MKYNTSLFLTICVIMALTVSFTEIQHQDKHFMNVNSLDYVLVIFHSSDKKSKHISPLRSLLTSLGKAKTIEDNQVTIELVDMTKLPFFDDHYDLKGDDVAILFIRNQIVRMDGFSAQIEKLYRKSSFEADMVSAIEKFVQRSLDSISVEIKDIRQFKELLGDKKVLGLYSGDFNDNFKRFFHVARKNIDFNFIHTFDQGLRKTIFNELVSSIVPETDSFSIVRHTDALNEFDNQQIVSFTSFYERKLTEFLEYERFDKLRDSGQGNPIFDRLVHKYQPLLLFVQGEERNSHKFSIFKGTVKDLPKKLIYSYTDTESSNSASYLQLFMLAGKSIMPEESLSLIWKNQSGDIKVIEFSQEFNINSIKDFVFNFLREHEQANIPQRDHLYDKANSIVNDGVGADEL